MLVPATNVPDRLTSPPTSTALPFKRSVPAMARSPPTDRAKLLAEVVKVPALTVRLCPMVIAEPRVVVPPLAMTS